MSEGDRHSANHVVNMLWRLINAAYQGDSEEDSLRFDDKELLEDVLRFDSLTTIAKHIHKVSVYTRCQERCAVLIYF